MPKLKLTKAILDAAERPVNGPTRYWDSEQHGLVAYVAKRGITWHYEVTHQTRCHRERLGPYPAMNVQQARDAAGIAEHQLKHGRVASATDRKLNLADAVALYTARPKLRSASYKAFVDKLPTLYLKPWASKPLVEITRSMCVEKHAEIGRKRGEVTANKVMQAFRSVWNNARKQYEHLNESPTIAVEWFEEDCERLPPGTKEPMNKPVHDLAAWRAAVNSLDNIVHRQFYFFVLMTGLRKTEALTLTWDQIDKDAGELFLPLTKNGKPFRLPLNDRHIAILEPLRGLHVKWVFPGRCNGDHLLEPERLAGYTVHGLRHTFGMTAAEIDISDDTISRLLNHTTGKITRRYAKPRVEALRPAMAAIVDELQRRLHLTSMASAA